MGRSPDPSCKVWESVEKFKIILREKSMGKNVCEKVVEGNNRKDRGFLLKNLTSKVVLDSNNNLTQFQPKILAFNNQLLIII